jgi:catechol 2,3-dioxygenase-like lactoylglutathione lyase family enzyme
MFGKPPFVIPDNYAVDVRNLVAARAWYQEKLGLNETKIQREDDSGRPFADMCISKNDSVLSLIELPARAAAEKHHVIFYSGNLEKCQKWLVERGVTVEPITSDSGGNRLFRFRDLDGNAIEVCVEP